MNWGLIGWFAGIVLTFAGLKFVLVAARTLLSKDTMKAGLDAINSKVTTSTKKFEKYLKKKVNARKVQKYDVEVKKPQVYIR